MSIEKGCVVQLHYTGQFESGEVFDSSLGKDPLEFKVGDGQVIKGIEEAVLGMVEGESKRVCLAPDDAYGPAGNDLIYTVPRENLPDQSYDAGAWMELHTQSGRVLNARIVTCDEQNVTFDFNHPLAGKTLVFQVEVVSVLPTGSLKS
ncbi:MAG: peptidylprolyl isomerase [Acidobacteria bacterium]|nr:peptidylprolyl isomerase [Acidobacteriota bacterium]